MSQAQAKVEKSFPVLDDERTPEVHCSTIQVGGERQYVAWFGGAQEGKPDVKIWFSTRSGTSAWSKPVVIAGEEGVVHWNPVLFLPNRNTEPERLILFYKIGTPIPEWRTYWIHSEDGGSTWSDRRELVPGDLSGGRGPSKNPVIVLSNGDWIAGASKEEEPNGVRKWDCFVDIAPKPVKGEEQGVKWERGDFVPLPADRGKEGGSFPGEGVIQPSLWEDTTHPGHVSMLMRSSNGWIQRSDSADYGRTWGESYNTTMPNNNSGQCVARMRDGRLVCAYNPVAKNWGPRHPLVCSISDDNGKTWRVWAELEKVVEGDEGIIKSDKTGINNEGRPEFSYPTVTPTADNDVVGVYVSYTWHRRGIAVVKLSDQ